MRSPQGDEWWWIWSGVSVIEFAWFWGLHKLQGQISTNIKEHPMEVVVMESIVVNEDLEE
jgi:hypothetical protein